MPTIENTASGLKAQIEKEIQQYLTEVVNIGEDYSFSQYKLIRRISLFESHTYPTGKFDSRGNYKGWFDITNPRIESEIKNIDFDTKDITVWSDRKSDELPCIICNLKLKEYLRETGQAEEINAAVEEGSGWGNVVWKKIKGGYERVDLKNFYVINQTAQCLDETPVIERHQFSQSDLRAKMKSWANIKEVIESCGAKLYKNSVDNQPKDTTTPYYDIYERNGEVCLKDLKEVKGEEPGEGDDDKYVFAKIIVAGAKESSTTTGVKIEYVLFADEMKGKDNGDLYKEFHRSRYKGRWWREGIYELLFDLQVRANQIGNQIAQGLETASKTILSSDDKLLVQNILTDMNNGDVIRAKGLVQVDMKMHAFDQLVAEWNQIQSLANDIANSSAIVRGTGIPSGAPFRTVQLLSQNANKLFDYVREKFGIPYSEMFEEWTIPDLVSTLTAPEVLRLTGDSDMLNRLRMLIVEDWYTQNLIAIGPHAEDLADVLKQGKMDELKARPQLLMKGVKAMFKDFEPHVQVVITGENSNKEGELQTLSTFIGLEADPVRRSYLVEKAMKRAGIDVGELPRSTPEQLQGVQPGQGAPQGQPSDLRQKMEPVGAH